MRKEKSSHVAPYLKYCILAWSEHQGISGLDKRSVCTPSIPQPLHTLFLRALKCVLFRICELEGKDSLPSWDFEYY